MLSAATAIIDLESVVRRNFIGNIAPVEERASVVGKETSCKANLSGGAFTRDLPPPSRKDEKPKFPRRLTGHLVAPPSSCVVAQGGGASFGQECASHLDRGEGGRDAQRICARRTSERQGFAAGTLRPRRQRHPMRDIVIFFAETP
jgi:hypothetical protein